MCVRFNAASITVKDSGKTIYHIDKVLRETGDVVDDGLHEIFVNTVIDDKTDIAGLMACFTKDEYLKAEEALCYERISFSDYVTKEEDVTVQRLACDKKTDGID